MKKNVVKMTEWKNLYPIKKIILLSVWLFGVLILYASFVALIKDHDFRTIFIISLDSVGLVKSFIPIKKYILTSYHCMPVLNQIFTKKELEKLLENEVFQKMTGSTENPLNRPELLESENWFCIHGKFISKNMAVIGRAWVAASLNNRDITPVKIFYMTGEFLKVKTGHSWNVSTIQAFNYLLWNEYKIIPAKVFSKDYERITTILKSTYSKIKEEKNLCEKEMIRYLLESGAEVKALFWNEIPGFKPLNKYEDEGKK